MNAQDFRVTNRRSGGFSLLEVLIAAVVLATGLLALAALQASLARNAADARARSQVAAFVDLAVERIRNAAGGSGFADVPPTDGVWVNPWDADDLAAVEASAGISNLAVSVTGTQYDGRSGTFVAFDPAVGSIATTSPQYKELHVAATWTDATGASRSYDLATIVSPRTTSDSSLPFWAPTGASNTQLVPVVRTPSPVEAGVIPIAIGDNSDTAATNPKPIISGGNVIRTSYEVLTYRNEDDGSVRQQRRVETAVIACACAADAAPTGAQFENAQWPAYWNGERYTLYSPSVAGTDPPGTAAGTGAAEDVTQDILCTECCRDHHDGVEQEHVRFDPFRTDTHQHYKLEDGVLVEAGADDNYVEACRMIRVDGFWRTAQDLDAKHFGMLKTDSFATSPVPDATAQDGYEDFALQFLKTNYMPGQTAQAADGIYETFGLNAPSEISISRPTPQDERYLHARGLYVDNIEDELEDKIAVAHANCERDVPEECILPLLAFTSINVTEAAFWSASDPASLLVDTDGFVVYRPNNPNRGRVNAVATAAPNALIDIIASIQPSNSGVAVRAIGVDPEDNVDATDEQVFRIQGGVGTGESGTFTVALTGLPASNRSPGVSWSLGTAGNNCQGPSPYGCTTSETLPAAADPSTTITVTFASYNRFEERNGTVSVTCPNSPNGVATPSDHSYTANGQKKIRYCRNYEVSSVSSGGVIDPVVLREGKVGDPNTGSGSEATEVDYPVNQGAALTATFAFQGETVAPVATCSFKNNGSLETVSFADCD